MRAKCHLRADADAKLERAISRTMRTLPMLRMGAECLICNHAAHTPECPIPWVIAGLEEHVGKIAPRVGPSKAALRMRILRAMRKTA